MIHPWLNLPRIATTQFDSSQHPTTDYKGKHGWYMLLYRSHSRSHKQSKYPQEPVTSRSIPSPDHRPHTTSTTFSIKHTPPTYTKPRTGPSHGNCCTWLLHYYRGPCSSRLIPALLQVYTTKLTKKVVVSLQMQHSDIFRHLHH